MSRLKGRARHAALLRSPSRSKWIAGSPYQQPLVRHWRDSGWRKAWLKKTLMS